MDLLQAVVVALVQMVEAVHIPENRKKKKKNQNGRMCVRIEKKGRERTPIALYAAY